MVKPYIKVRVSTLVHGQALPQGQGQYSSSWSSLTSRSGYSCEDECGVVKRMREGSVAEV